MPQDNQLKHSFNERELDKIKETFKGNDYLLKTMRALFFGLGVSDSDKELIKSTFANDELFSIIANRFYPELSKDSEIGMVQDIWLGAETMVFDKAPSTIAQAIQYKDRSSKMTKHALGLLRNPDLEAPRVLYEPSQVVNDELGIELLARNQYVRHIESQLLFLKVIAETHKKDDKEKQKTLEKNSTK